MSDKKPIKSFRDLDVYSSSYEASIIIAKKVLPELPKEEKYDLHSQLSRSSKAVPRLIAEGYAKKHQRAGFQKYLDDAMAESNESIVGLEHARDIYNINAELCNQLVERYDIIGKQLYNLAKAWDKFKNKRKKTDDD